MKKSLIKVGIGSEDSNEITSRKIIQIAEKLQSFELCELIVYNCSSVVLSKKETLDIQPYFVQNTPFSFRTSSTEKIKQSTKILHTKNHFKLENTTKEEAIISSEKSIVKGMQDLKTGKIDVLVLHSNDSSLHQIESQFSKKEKGIPIWINDSFYLTKVLNSNSIEEFKKTIKVLHRTLYCDFMISLPRIAILSSFSMEKVEPIINSAFLEGTFCFGPFHYENFFYSESYKTFNASIVITDEPIDFVFHLLKNKINSLLIGNLPYTITVFDEIDSLQQAVYLAIDICQKRKINYNLLNNSLKKSYHSILQE